jgi:hypothetical protein
MSLRDDTPEPARHQMLPDKATAGVDGRVAEDRRGEQDAAEQSRIEDPRAGQGAAGKQRRVQPRSERLCRGAEVRVQVDRDVDKANDGIHGYQRQSLGFGRGLAAVARRGRVRHSGTFLSPRLSIPGKLGLPAPRQTRKQ